MAENAGPAGGLKGWAAFAGAKSGGTKGPQPKGVHPDGPKKKAGPPAPGTGAAEPEPKEGGDENDLAMDEIDAALETLEKKFTDGKGAQLINEMKSKLNELRDEHESGADDEDDDSDDDGNESGADDVDSDVAE
jgi:hypothetical protein